MPFKWLSKFFKNQPPLPAPPQRPAAATAEQWELYECMMDNNRATVGVNLALMTDAPDPRYPSLVWLTLKVQNSRADGLPHEDELEQLYLIEDILDNAARWSENALYLGRVTHAGVRDHYFQTASPERLNRALGAAMKTHPEYQYELGNRDDPEWSTYRESLYPSPRQHQIILDSKVFLALRKSGDTLDRERGIEHWAYFATAVARDEFVTEAAKLGFVLVEKGNNPNPEVETANPFMAKVARSDVPNDKFTEKVTWPLCEAAERLGGVYDGWETSVVK